MTSALILICNVRLQWKSEGLNQPVIHFLTGAVPLDLDVYQQLAHPCFERIYADKFWRNHCFFFIRHIDVPTFIHDLKNKRAHLRANNITAMSSFRLWAEIAYMKAEIFMLSN